MSYGVKQSTPSFVGGGFEIHFGAMPQRRYSLYMLVAIFVLLAFSLSVMLLKAYALDYAPSPIPVSSTSPASALATPADTPTPSPAPAVVPARPVDHSVALQAAIDGWVQAHSDHRWGVDVHGLKDDPTHAASSPDAVSNMASIYKLLLMYALVQKVPRAQWDTTNITASGKPFTLTACVEAMLLRSDNPCGEAVGSYVGWSNANKKLVALGLTNTHLSTGTNGTAGDIGTYLQLLYNGKLFSADDTQYFLGLMGRQIYRQGIPAGCSGCTVQDKTGDVGTVRNDAAIVTSGDRAYEVVIMSNGASYGQIADLARTIQGVMTTTP